MATLTQDEIAAESAQRPRAAQYAFAGGFASLVGGIGALVFARGLPGASPENVVDLSEALNSRLTSGASPGRSYRALTVEHIGDHLPGFIAPTFLTALGLLLLIVPVLLIFEAARRRKDDLKPLAGRLFTFGAVGAAIGTVGAAVVIGIAASGFSGDSAEAARSEINSQLAVALQFIGLMSSVALAIGLIIICLNAMRVGLLTRFVGVLGIIVGVTIIIPAGSIDQINLIRSSWAVFVGLLLLGKMPGAYRDPPAWARGEAEQAAAGGGTAEPVADAPERRSRKRRK